MFSWRISSWYVQSFWRKYRRIIIISLIIGVSMVWLFPRLLMLIPQQKKTTYVGRVGLYTWVDLPRDLQEKMSAGLTSLDEAGQAVPTLAERWTVEDDGKVFRFLLRQNLRWQDGKPLVTDDILYNFADVQIVRTENEVVFRLRDPYAPFPVVVAQPLFREVQERRWGFIKRTRLIGLGEYHITHVEYNGPYVKNLIIENAKERFIYRFYATQADAITGFRMGKVDKLEGINSIAELLPREQEIYNIDPGVNPYQLVAVYFNTTHPDLTKEMRQALNYATRKPGPDDEKIRVISPISPLSWAYNATNEINDFSYDLEAAVQTYVKVNPRTPLQLTLRSSVALLSEAQVIAEDWQALGASAVQRCEDGEIERDPDNAGLDCSRFAITVAVQAVRDIAEYDAIMLAREIPADPDQYPWWHSNQASNLANYQNPRVDKLLEDARTSTDQQRRKVMYLEFQKYLVEDVSAMFLWFSPEYTVSRKPWW